jgi:hypothetical protein
MEILRVTVAGATTDVALVGDAVRNESITYLNPTEEHFVMIKPGDRLVSGAEIAKKPYQRCILILKLEQGQRRSNLRYSLPRRS